MNDEHYWKPGDGEPVRTMTIKPVEKYYYQTVFRSMLVEAVQFHRKTVELETTTHIYEYQDAGLWFDIDPPIFGKFDFLKELK